MPSALYFQWQTWCVVQQWCSIEMFPEVKLRIRLPCCRAYLHSSNKSDMEVVARVCLLSWFSWRPRHKTMGTRIHGVCSSGGGHRHHHHRGLAAEQYSFESLSSVDWCKSAQHRCAAADLASIAIICFLVLIRTMPDTPTTITTLPNLAPSLPPHSLTPRTTWHQIKIFPLLAFYVSLLMNNLTLP